MLCFKGREKAQRALLNAILPQEQGITSSGCFSSPGFLSGPNDFSKPSDGFRPCKLETDLSFAPCREGATYFYCWYILPNQSLWCHFPDSSRWSLWATQHTCFADCPWTAAVQSKQKHSGRTLSESSHLTASSLTGLGHPQWSSGLRR